MSTYLLSFTIYWAICFIITIAIFTGMKKLYDMGNVPLWKEMLFILLASLFLPFVIIGLVISVKFGKKKPQPINMELLSLMEFDTVKDGSEYTTLRKYNEIHGTSYTLKDVYGEDYATEHFNDEHREDLGFKAKVPEFLGFPMTIKNTEVELACEALGNGIVHGMFDDFINMLDDSVETILYKSKTIKGKKDVIDYWIGWKKRYFDTGQIKDPKLIDSAYNGDIALSLDSMLVYAYVEEKKIKKLLLVNHYISPLVGYKDDMTEKPLSLDEVKDEIVPMTEKDKLSLKDDCENRVPCLSCGRSSSSLKWYIHDVKAGSVGYRSAVSVCPHCNKVVEYSTIIRYRN